MPIYDSSYDNSPITRVVLTNSSGQPVATGASADITGPSTTAAVTSVSDTASSTTLIAANTSARERVIHNDSASILYVKFGTTASSTDYTVKLYTDDILTTTYTGRIDGIWSADSTGAARITETS